MTAIIFITFIVLLLIRVPVSFSLLIASILSLVLASTIDSIVVIQRLYTSTESFSLIAIPFFILAGGFMESGGISKRLVDFASAMVGHIRGGLAMSGTVGSMFFAGISGSAAADTAAVGSILIPAMVKKGYGKDVATSVMATSGSIGIIIPPSIPMILLGVTAGVSIGGMFLGGVIPGILVGLALMVTSYIIAKKRNLPCEKRASINELFTAFRKAILAIMTMVIIVGGIMGGVFTATEASIVTVVYSFIVGAFVYKELKIKDIPKIFINTAKTTGIVVFCIAAASSFGWILAAENIPALIADTMFGISSNKFILMLMITGVLLFLGCFLDPSPIIIIVVPIIMPIAMKLGISPIHFGIITIVNMAIAQCTPPVGVTLFVSTSLSKASIAEVLPTYSKYVFTMILVLLLITFVPVLVTFLPETLMGIK